MPPRSKSQGESKQGLIITLVFFILTTLGLGVATYFGFSEQEKYVQQAKKAEDEKKVFQADRDWYKFQAQMAYSFIGKSEGMEGLDTLGTQKGQFDSGSMKGGKDKDFATKVLKSLEKEVGLGWNGNQPQETLLAMIDRLKKEKATLANDKVNMKNQMDAKAKELDARNEELKAARKDYEDKLKALTVDLKKDFEKSTKDLEDFRTKVDTGVEELKKVRLEAEEAKTKYQKELGVKVKEIGDLRALVARKQDEIDQFKLRNPEAPPSMRTDWKIIRMDSRGLNPYINLGSADHVKSQLTFTVHGLAADGRPNPRPKGTLEVVNVIGPHLSQTRITSIKDRDRDPITEGDVIYNGSWNPNIKKHVAIAGIIDLGDGRDSLYEFMRNLERQNIVVDAYMDPKDASMKGRISYQTDYLILGGVPDLGTGRAAADVEKMVLGQKHMQEEAKKYGVQVKGLGAYLELIGYRLPRSTRTESPSLYNPQLRPDQAPRLGGDKVPPPMKPDK